MCFAAPSLACELSQQHPTTTVAAGLQANNQLGAIWPYQQPQPDSSIKTAATMANLDYKPGADDETAYYDPVNPAKYVKVTTLRQISQIDRFKNGLCGST